MHNHERLYVVQDKTEMEEALADLDEADLDELIQSAVTHSAVCTPWTPLQPVGNHE